MKFDQVLGKSGTNISILFLAQFWNLETYDFDKMPI